MTKIKVKRNKNYFKISDYWDISQITEEQARAAYQDYRVFAQGFGFGSSVRYQNGKILLAESTDRITTPFDITKDSMMKRLNLYDWQFASKIEANGLKVMVIYADVSINFDIIVSLMKSLGWSKSYVADQVDIYGLKFRAISFDPMYQPSATKNVRRWKHLKHVTPLYNLKSILSNGLKPMSKNDIYDYPKRLHLLKPTITSEELDNFLVQLFLSNSNKNNNGLYCIVAIDVDNVPMNVDFYLDPRYEYGVYTKQEIPPSAITSYYIVDCNTLIK